MVKFFLISLEIGSEIEIKEMLLRRYNNIDYILQMEPFEFLFFLQKAREKETEERLFNQWVVQLPHMEENYISLDRKSVV